MDPLRHRPHAHHRIVSLRCHRVLDAVEVLPLPHRRLLAQMLHVALELGVRQVRIDPVILQMPCVPQRLPGFGCRGLPRLPHADHPPRQQLRHRLVEDRVVLVDQHVPQLLHEVLVEAGRVFVAELRADLEND
ncbi:uncharacterized protein M6B38_194845 [Iris pallida]|uniref:Uncharacterized protein n=1 Tax=Iris pallida TaxID=29817 RepID=A0AAX6EEG4_IRIPA|nr:uncharacterized protein M6B38_194845 [Iris pallida]